MPITSPHLVTLPARLARKPKPVTRKRIYGTLELVFGALVIWGVITADEAAQLKAMAEAVSAAVAVNDFAPEELTSRGAKHSGDKSFQASHRPAAE